MGIVKVVTDFDNTVTEEKELEPFFEAYSRRFYAELGIPKSQYKCAIAIVKRDMGAEPLKYGWKHNGFFSAPVTGDPIGSNTVAHIELMHRIMEGNLPDLQVANVLTDETAVLNLNLPNHKWWGFYGAGSSSFGMMGLHIFFRCF